MTDDLFINGKDAYATWGISLDETSLSALMTPVANKDFIENKSRLENGKRVVTVNPKVEDRSFALQIHLTASDKAQFFARYELFCKVLAMGVLDIRTKYQPEVVYRTIYQSCSQFSQFMQGIGKFSLKLNEPDPSPKGRKSDLDS